jgi:hypothetical protein
MTTLCKLTNQDNTTRNNCLWGENITHTADGNGELCSKHWVHAYTHPLLAVLLNPIHGNFANPKLWECEGDVGKSDYGLKVGCTRLTTLREIALPVVTLEQRIRFGIGCAWAVCTNEHWRTWASMWLAGTDRTWAAAEAMAAARAVGAAKAAKAAAAYAAAAAAWAAEEAAAEAAIPLDLVALAEWSVSDETYPA